MLYVDYLVIRSFQETFPSQSSSEEPRLDFSNEEPMIGPSCTQLHSETSDSLVL